MSASPPEHDLDQALDALPEEGGEAKTADDHGETVVDVAEADRLGVRVRGVTVRHREARDVVEEAAALPERLRRLGEPVEPVEVDPRLGGAILRTAPDEVESEFFEVGVRPDEAEIRRYRVDEEGGREATDWTMTRDQLRRLVDDIRER